jgi:transposase
MEPSACSRGTTCKGGRPVNSIFQRKNPAIENVFVEAGSPKKVMCIPMDYAKRQHTALVCNGEGSQLRGAFNVFNNPAGVGFLEDIIAGLCRKHSIRKKHVFFGGEDCSAIAFNFIHAMLQKGYLGIGLNARDAALERENQVASTDKLDLLGIASLLVNKKRGRTLSAEYSDARVLRELTHHRTALVKARTASAYRIHHLVDQLLPGFLDEKQSGLTPFSKPCLWVMGQNFSPRQLLARKSEVMAEKLRLFMVQDAEGKVARLKELARSALPPPAALCATLQINMGHEVSVYEHLEECIHDVEKSVAHHLAPTPGAMLTTVPGIGITLAAELYAELGDPARQRCLKRLSSYAGLVARLKQTGGPDKEAQTRGRSRRACVPLKRCVMDIALKVGQYGHPELKSDYQRREAGGQDARLTFGRRMLRIAVHLIRTMDFFLPPSLLHDSDRELRREYYARAWDKVLIKWRDRSSIQQALADGTPLEQWRQMFNEAYNLELSKLSPQYDRLRQR